MKRSRIPKFKNESEEFQFWSGRDSTAFFSETEEVIEPLEVTKPKRKKQRISRSQPKKMPTRP